MLEEELEKRKAKEKRAKTKKVRKSKKRHNEKKSKLEKCMKNIKKDYFTCVSFAINKI